MRVYLGGTQNGSMWREQFIGHLNMDCIVPETRNDKWSDIDRLKDNEVKSTCDIHLYAITPMMVGVYNIAETLESCLKYKDKKTIVCIMDIDGFLHFNDKVYKDLKLIGNLITDNGGEVFYALGDAISFLKQLRKDDGN